MYVGCFFSLGLACFVAPLQSGHSRHELPLHTKPVPLQVWHGAGVGWASTRFACCDCVGPIETMFTPAQASEGMSSNVRMLMIAFIVYPAGLSQSSGAVIVAIANEPPQALLTVDNES